MAAAAFSGLNHKPSLVWAIAAAFARVSCDLASTQNGTNG